jgi:V8-like Glu-specific endopeptidase
MIYLLMLIALLSCDLTRSQAVRKIQFSSRTSIHDIPFLSDGTESVNAAEQSATDDEETDASSNQLVMVTPQGYEYSVDIAELKNLLKFYLKAKEDESYSSEEQQENEFDIAAIQSVVGKDSRTHQKPNKYPFTAMGKIEIGCSGTFIGSNVVMTAGHCVHYKNEWHRYLKIHREKGCFPKEGIVYEWSHAIAYKHWIEHSSPDYDIAWIIYESSSPVTMPFTSRTPAEGTRIYIYGYPADKIGSCLYGSTCGLSKRTKDRLAYQCDTFGGESGSAIYYHKKGLWESHGKPMIIGVHGYGTEDFKNGYNKGTRLTKAYADTAKEIIAVYE